MATSTVATAITATAAATAVIGDAVLADGAADGELYATTPAQWEAVASQRLARLCQHLQAPEASAAAAAAATTTTTTISSGSADGASDSSDDEEEEEAGLAEAAECAGESGGGGGGKSSKQKKKKQREAAAAAAATTGFGPVVPFEAAAMTRYMEGAYYETQQRTVALLRANAELFSPRGAWELTMDQQRERTQAQMEVIARSGLLDCAHLAPGGDLGLWFKAIEPTAWADSSLTVKLSVHYGLYGGSLIHIGTERHRPWLDEVNKLSNPGMFAMTELTHGSNVRALETTATYDAGTGEFVLHSPTPGSTKWWIGNAGRYGRTAIVFANLVVGGEQHGVFPFVVQVRRRDAPAGAAAAAAPCMPGVLMGDIGHKIGLNGVDNGWIRFDQCRIPRENLLNRFGDVSRDGVFSSPLPSANKRFAALLQELTQGRIGIVIGSCCFMKMGSLIAIRYAAQRRQFGPAGGSDEQEIRLLDYPAHQRKLMPLLATIYAFHFAGRRLLRTEHMQMAEMHVLSAGMKAVCSWTADSALALLREACGGHGYAAYNRLGQLRADHDVYKTFEGENSVLLQQVAKDLLAQFRKELGAGGKFTGPLKYLRKRLQSILVSRNPIVVRSIDRQHLLSADFQLQVFAHRAGELLHTSAQNLKARIMTGGKDMLTAWNESMSELLETAKAHTERIILKQFVNAVESCPDPTLRPVLKMLCDLYALERIEADMGRFRNQELLKPKKARAIAALVAELCAELRHYALPLVDAFGIPDDLVQAPIGLKSDYVLEMAKAVGVPLP